MTNRSRSLVACALAMSGLLAVACDETTPGTDAGPNPMEDSGPGIDGGPETDSGPTPETDGGPTPSDCDARATNLCSQHAACDMNSFIGRYENMAICVEVETQACETPNPLAPPPSDPAGCAAAQASGCDAFISFGSDLPAACIPAPGPVERDGDCGYHSQCGTEGGTRLYCRSVTDPLCEDGSCFPPTPAGSSCNDTTFDPCDTYSGYACVHAYSAREMMGTPAWNQQRCAMIERGGAGADCFADTEKQCAAGFTCIEGECMAVIGEGMTCNQAASLCDTRLGLACVVRDGESTPRCTRGAIFVQVGAESGLVDGVTQNCSAYALPSTETPPLCELRRRLGETCSASRANCWPGLTCESGTCEEPDATTCD